VGVDVDDVDLAQRLHSAAERVADRVVTADRDHQRSALDDPPCGVGDASVICLGVRALNRDVANIRHRHADEVVTIGLDVVPALGALVVPGASRPRVVELRLGCLTGCRRPGPLTGGNTRLRRAAVVRDADEGHLRIEHVEVAQARNPEECPRHSGESMDGASLVGEGDSLMAGDPVVPGGGREYPLR
jgi:hypothetical protein